jgi:hypothetical protein
MRTWAYPGAEGIHPLYISDLNAGTVQLVDFWLEKQAKEVKMAGGRTQMA